MLATALKYQIGKAVENQQDVRLWIALSTGIIYGHIDLDNNKNPNNISDGFWLKNAHWIAPGHLPVGLTQVDYEKVEAWGNAEEILEQTDLVKQIKKRDDEKISTS